MRPVAGCARQPRVLLPLLVARPVAFGTLLQLLPCARGIRTQHGISRSGMPAATACPLHTHTAGSDGMYGISHSDGARSTHDLG